MKSRICIIIFVLLAGIIAIPGANAENRTMDTVYYLTHADTLAGQKDMSMYNPPLPVEPIHTMNETTARFYPNMTACGNNGCIVNRPCSFPFTRCESPLTLMVMYNVNTTNPGRSGTVIGYSLSGWPLQNPGFVSRSGIPNLNLPFETLAGMFYTTEIVSVGIAPSASYLPSREFQDYTNAPSLTAEQKETALRIAGDSTKFQEYLNESHGSIMFEWAYPYSGVVHISMTSGSAAAPEYGLASADVNLALSQPVNVSFTDWKKYW